MRMKVRWNPQNRSKASTEGTVRFGGRKRCVVFSFFPFGNLFSVTSASEARKIIVVIAKPLCKCSEHYAKCVTEEEFIIHPETQKHQYVVVD